MTLEEQEDENILEEDETTAPSAEEVNAEGAPAPSEPQEDASGEDAAAQIAARREALIAELTGAAPTEQEETTEDEEEESSEETTSETETDETPDPGTEAEEDAEDFTDEEMGNLKRRTRKRIEHFRAEVRKAKEREPFAKYGEDVIKFARENEIEPDDLSQWINVGATVHKGGQPAIDMLVGMAKNLGYAPASAPPTETTPTTGKLPDWLQAKVDSFDIDLEVAREIAAKLPREQPAAPPPPQPSPAPTQERDSSEALEVGRQALEALVAEASGKYPADWEKRLYPQVRAKMAEFQGAPPAQWPRLFKLALESSVASIRTPPKAVRQALTPSTGASGGTGKTPKTPRERMLAKLTGG